MGVVRMWLAGAGGLLPACPPAIDPAPVGPIAPSVEPIGTGAGLGLGRLDDRMVDFAFDGGQLEFELYRDGTRVQQLVRNRYAVAITLHWEISGLDNVEAVSALDGT